MILFIPHNACFPYLSRKNILTPPPTCLRKETPCFRSRDIRSQLYEVCQGAEAHGPAVSPCYLISAVHTLPPHLPYNRPSHLRICSETLFSIPPAPTLSHHVDHAFSSSWGERNTYNLNYKVLPWAALSLHRTQLEVNIYNQPICQFLILGFIIWQFKFTLLHKLNFLK